MSYYHLTKKERLKIAAYLALGLKPGQIDSQLGVHRSTISKELRRCPSTYSADLAQEHVDQMARRKGRKSLLTPELKAEIEKGLTASCRLNRFVVAIGWNKSQWSLSRPSTTGSTLTSLT